MQLCSGDSALGCSQAIPPPRSEEIQGVGAQSQNLCYEKNQKPIQIQHINFLRRRRRRTRRRETELTTGTNSFGCWNRGREATQYLNRGNAKNSPKEGNTLIWGVLAQDLGTQLYFQVCPWKYFCLVHIWACMHEANKYVRSVCRLWDIAHFYLAATKCPWCMLVQEC